MNNNLIETISYFFCCSENGLKGTIVNWAFLLFKWKVAGNYANHFFVIFLQEMSDIKVKVEKGLEKHLDSREIQLQVQEQQLKILQVGFIVGE